VSGRDSRMLNNGVGFRV